MKRLLQFLIASSLFASPALAGYFEIGASGSYKQSYQENDSWETFSAYTGSAAWYFGQMSAFEMSYTYGSQSQYLHFKDRPDQTVTNYFEMAGADFILTFLGQEAVIRPYIKGGGAYMIRKDLVYESGGNQVVTNQATGFVPSAGAGFRIAITKDFSLKIGADGWASTPGKADRWDYVMRAGISWMF